MYFITGMSGNFCYISQNSTATEREEEDGASLRRHIASPRGALQTGATSITSVIQRKLCHWYSCTNATVAMYCEQGLVVLQILVPVGMFRNAN
jgi:hypothetical protein